MNKTLMICLVFTLNASVCFSLLPGELVGVWNLGVAEQQFKTRIVNSERFLASHDAIVINNYPNMKALISFDGYAYNILRVQGEFPVFHLFVTYSDGANVWKAQLRAQFNDRDHLWFEVIPGKDTDPDFSAVDFPGKSVVYWRAKKVE